MRVLSFAIATLLQIAPRAASAERPETEITRIRRQRIQKGQDNGGDSDSNSYNLGLQRRRLDEEEDSTNDDQAIPSAERCSCSPLEYNFAIDLSQGCLVDDLDGSPGIGQTFCLLGSNTAEPTQRRLGGSSSRNNGRGLKKKKVKIEFDDEDVRTLGKDARIDAADELEVISVQFLEFDTSGALIVINQDDSYANVTLGDGDVISFASVSSNLDPGEPIEDQLDLLPGGVQVTLRARSVDDETGEVTIVSNRITWSYTNECDEQPLEEGMAIGWTTLDSLTPASNAFCPAAVPATTTTAATTTIEAIVTDPPTTSPGSVAPTDAPVTPIQMCPFCTDGLTDPDLLLPTGDVTCQTASEFAAMLPLEDDNCELLQLAETLCCPPTPPPTDPPVAAPVATDSPVAPVATDPPVAPEVSMSMPQMSLPPQMSMPETSVPGTPLPPQPIFSAKSAKSSKSCKGGKSGDSGDTSCSSKSSKSSKSKTKKTPTKTKTHKGDYADTMAKVAKEGDMDAKSGKALVEVDAKAEKMGKASKAIKSGKSVKSVKSSKSKAVAEKKSKSAKSAKSTKDAKGSKKLFHHGVAHGVTASASAMSL